jgi:hypothetical protein
VQGWKDLWPRARTVRLTQCPGLATAPHVPPSPAGRLWLPTGQLCTYRRWRQDGWDQCFLLSGTFLGMSPPGSTLQQYCGGHIHQKSANNTNTGWVRCPERTGQHQSAAWGVSKAVDWAHYLLAGFVCKQEDDQLPGLVPRWLWNVQSGWQVSSRSRAAFELVMRKLLWCVFVCVFHYAVSCGRSGFLPLHSLQSSANVQCFGGAGLRCMCRVGCCAYFDVLAWPRIPTVYYVPCAAQWCR